jgi:hypothetical protein
MLLGYSTSGGKGASRVASTLRQAEEALRLANSRDNSDADVWANLALCNLQTVLDEGDTDDQHYRMQVLSY